MAYKASISDDSSLIDFFLGVGRSLFQGANHFWNINKDVGWGYDNKQSDVMLIQFLINSTGATTKLVEDGIFGKKTYKAIKAFQKDYNGFGMGSLYADGAINYPVINIPSSGFGTGGGLYTIHALNSVYQKHEPVYFRDITMAPSLPTVLCHLLSV
ncbi:MAG TPA: peptidoglycan-binding protein [Pyrinomonadaceae bacterium]|nr:peptidoglycan-binding protein [Pyrinomonadaceae bacterium]